MKLIKVVLLAGICTAIATVAWHRTATALAEGQGCGSETSGAACCSGDMKAHQHQKDGTDASLIEKQKVAYPLDTCVVLGNKLGSDGEAVDYLYKGRLVRFCCAGCIAAFEKDPGKYLAKLDAAAKGQVKAGAAESKKAPTTPEAQPKAQAAAEVWTCPMHPEVREGKPGKCPKCGMNLVKAAATSNAATK